MNQPGNTYGDWRRIDVDGNDLKIADFSNVWPYNEIKTVTVDGQQMVRIPKIYVNNTKLTKGAYAGKWQYSIANTKIDANWHVHPAFMNQGKECSALDLSCYEASHDTRDNMKASSIPTSSFWEGINQIKSIAASQRRNTLGGTADQTGWHCWDIYCQHLLARLMLIEFGTANFGFSEAESPEFIYRNIHQPAGGSMHPTWLPGMKTDDKTIYIISNYGDRTFMNTGIPLPGSGWPMGYSHLIGKNFDMGDLFIADRVSSNINDGATSGYQVLSNWHSGGSRVNFRYYFTGYRGSGSREPSKSNGMFAFTHEWTNGGANEGSNGARCAQTAGASGGSIRYGALRFRLAHFVS